MLAGTRWSAWSVAWVVALSCLALAVGCRSRLPQRPDGDAFEPGRAPGRLSRAVEPLDYRLRLRVDPRLPRFYGEATIRVRLHQPTAVLHFHAEGIRFRSATFQIAGSDATHPLVIREHHPHPGVKEWEASFARELPRGQVVMRFSYDAPMSSDARGLYRVQWQGRWYALTQFQAAYARRVFPCFDEPGWKVPFRLTLVIPGGMRAFANTPVFAQSQRGAWTEVQFRRSAPLPTYLVGFVLGDLVRVDGPPGRVPIGGIVGPGDERLIRPALEMAAELIPRLEQYLGGSFPYEKVDLVAAPQLEAGAMENAGLITFQRERLLLDAQAMRPARQRVVGITVAHELAHQWFGNLVTMAWWDDLWLNEAFATWMTTKMVDAWRPHFEARERLLRWRRGVLAIDGLATATPIRQPVTTIKQAEHAFNMLTYGKGATVLAMLESWVGAGAFRDGVRDYLRRHSWKSARAASLFAALEGRTGKPVGAVARSFIDRAGVPAVNVRCTGSGEGEVRIVLEQTRYRPLGARFSAAFPGGRPWMIPACLRYAIGDRRHRVCRLITGASTAIVLEHAAACPSWIHPNADEKGYYRWVSSARNLRALVAASQSLSRFERAALLDHAWAAVSAGKLPPGEYLDALASLAGSREPAIVRQLILGVQRVADVWTGRTAQLAVFAARLLEPVGRALGWQPRAGEQPELTVLRPEVLAALGRYAASRWVLTGAVERARGFLRDPTAANADLAPVGLALAASQRQVPVEELVRLLAGGVTAAVRARAVEALAAQAPGQGLEAALRAITDGRLTGNEARHLLSKMMQRQATRSQVVHFLERHVAEVSRRVFPGDGPAQGMVLSSLVRQVCRASLKRRLETLFRATAAVSGKAWEQSLELAEQCMALRSWGQAAVKQWFRPRKPQKSHSGGTRRSSGSRSAAGSSLRPT